jgi:hypothetical protein
MSRAFNALFFTLKLPSQLFYDALDQTVELFAR